MRPVFGEVDNYVDQLKRKGTFEEYGLDGKDISDGEVIESIAGDWGIEGGSGGFWGCHGQSPENGFIISLCDLVGQAHGIQDI